MLKRPAKKEEPSELQQMFQKLKRSLKYALVFSLGSNILMLALPIYSLQVYDRVLSSHSMETLIFLTTITLVCFLFFSSLTTVRGQIMQGISDWLDVNLAPRLLEISVFKASLGGATTAGQLQRDLGTVRGFINGGFNTLLDVPWSIIFILVIYMISPVLGFVSVIGAVLLVLFALFNEFATKSILERAQENLIQSNALADTAARNAEAIEAMGMMGNVSRNWVEHGRKGAALVNLAGKRGNMVQSLSRFFRMAVQIANIGIGGYLALKNEISSGGMIASSILAGRALGPFENAIAMWKNVIAARDSYHRIDDAIRTAPKVRGSMALPRPQGRLTVENAYFTPPGIPPIIKGVSFSLEPGESLGIIGPSAAGKSTLAKMIMGILPPTHGSIRLDGAETFKWNRADVGQHVGYMPQQMDLFNGTIKDNIARMEQGADDEAVLAAAMFAGAHEMILRLPNGYETQYVYGNLNLSPGQRQRIGLARALYRTPSFVVLDEPNTNLDGDGERALVETMARMKRAGITFIVVAHRPSVVGNVDKLLMLRGGTIESFGPRDEVMRRYAAPANPRAAQASRGAAPQANPNLLDQDSIA